MQADKTTTSNTVNRWCNGWACVCFGFMVGFGAGAMMSDREFAPLSIRFTFQAIVIPLSFLVMALPRAIVELARLIRRRRRLAA